MTAFTLEGPLAQAVYPGGTTFALESVDPTTRADVATVAITKLAIYGYDRSGTTAGLDLPDVWPLYSPQDVPDGIGSP